MKFRLFGGFDCPDLLLAHLAALSATCDACGPAVVGSLCECALGAILSTTAGPPLDGDGSPEDPWEGLGSAHSGLLVSLSLSGVKGGKMNFAQAVVGLRSLMDGILRYRVPFDVAVKELTMLGLAKEAADAVVAALRPERDNLQQRLLRNALPRAQHWTAATAGSGGAPLLLSSVTPLAVLPVSQARCSVWRNKQSGVHRVEVVALAARPKPRGDGQDGQEGSSTVHAPLLLADDKLRALLAEMIVARESLRLA